MQAVQVRGELFVCVITDRDYPIGGSKHIGKVPWPAWTHRQSAPPRRRPGGPCVRGGCQPKWPAPSWCDARQLWRAGCQRSSVCRRRPPVRPVRHRAAPGPTARGDQPQVGFADDRPRISSGAPRRRPREPLVGGVRADSTTSTGAAWSSGGDASADISWSTIANRPESASAACTDACLARSGQANPQRTLSQ